MQGTEIITDSNQETYCIIDPIVHLQQSIHIQASALLQCRYCKSLFLPTPTLKHSQCPICHCFTQLPPQYTSLTPVSIPTSTPILTTQHKRSTPHPTNNKATNKIKDMNSNNKAKLRLLLVCQSVVGNVFIEGLQALKSICSDFHEGAVEIGLIVFDRCVKVVELEEDGRVIVVNKDSYEIINDKFYPATPSIISYLLTTINQPALATTQNPTKILSQLLPILSQSIPTCLILLSNLGQQPQIHAPPPSSSHSIQTYCIFQIPYSVNSHSQIEDFNVLNKNVTKVKYIVNTDTHKAITEKVYYQLYQILWDWVVGQVAVQASRERKYPPQILTWKARNLGSLKDVVIVRLGREVEKNQKIQVRIKFTELKTIQYWEQKQEQKQMEEGHDRILIINNEIPEIAPASSCQMSRYIRLKRFLDKNPTNFEINNMLMSNKNYIDIDICQFWKQASYMQKIQLRTSSLNINCIYAIWPWVGVTTPSKSKQKTEQSSLKIKQKHESSEERQQRSWGKKVKFVYYFTGYYITHEQIKHIKKGQQVAEQLPYHKQITQLNELCQVLYVPLHRNLPNYYENIVEDIETPIDLADSDQEEDVDHDDLLRKYYEHRISN